MPPYRGPERRRGESLKREVLWTDAQREQFREGLPIRRAGNGVSARWSHDDKSIAITGRDTLIIVLLAASLGFIAWTNLKAFASIENQHLTLLSAQDNLACVLLMPQEARNQYRGDPGHVCDYFRLMRTMPTPRP